MGLGGVRVTVYRRALGSVGVDLSRRGGRELVSVPTVVTVLL